MDLILWMTAAVVGWAQAPTGTIVGTVTDESGASIPGAKIRITSPDTGRERVLTTSLDGSYSAAALAAGTYEVRVEATGFRGAVRPATVETGGATTVDLSLAVGTVQEAVTVAAATPQIHYDNHRIDGVVTRGQIASLPLNGRSFLQLAMLEPGVTAVPTSGGQYNRQFDISVLGADHRATRVTVDGGDVLDPVTGGTGQNFSQEIVQEFQCSTLNFDLSTGLTGAGAINIVTRSGTNAFHGGGYYFYRDHNMAAYPALTRDPVNSDPFFARRQAGVQLGGPIRADRVFFFTNLEHNNQDAVFTVQPRSPSFARFGRIAPSPFNGKQISARLDFQVSRRNTAFLRYSHDGNDTFAPLGSANLPSNWRQNSNWADQSLAGLTTALRPEVVNELRFSYSYPEMRAMQGLRRRVDRFVFRVAPEDGPLLGERRRGQQPVHALLEGVRRSVVEESADLFPRGNPARQIQIRAPEEIPVAEGALGAPIEASTPVTRRRKQRSVKAAQSDSDVA